MCYFAFFYREADMQLHGAGQKGCGFVFRPWDEDEHGPALQGILATGFVDE